MVWTGPSIRQADADPVLVEFFAEHGCEPEPSRILSTDIWATAFNRERLGMRRVVDLSCGHKAVTRNQHTMVCPRCAEMMRQGMDYEGWINRREHTYDGLIWRKDPVRALNEPTDLSGNFIHDPEHVPHD